MGGIWGLAASTALENLPVELRGLGSGIVQQGYAAGYLLAAVVNLTVVPHNPHTWRAMFWCGSSLLFFSAILRALLPESAVFLRVKAAKKELGAVNNPNKTRIFLKETKEMLKRHWLLCIYAILLMAGASFICHRFLCWRAVLRTTRFAIGFNFLSHGSQVRIQCLLELNHVSLFFRIFIRPIWKMRKVFLHIALQLLQLSGIAYVTSFLNPCIDGNLPFDPRAQSCEYPELCVHITVKLIYPFFAN